MATDRTCLTAMICSALILAGLVIGPPAVSLAAKEEKARQEAPKAQPTKPVYELSEATVHKNLAVFLIHGRDKIKHREFLTLGEALKDRKITVHETDNVGQLVVENHGNVAIYIQSGEIVKGGKQDRVIQFDVILPPKCGKVKAHSFCVEQGRWSRRGGEAADKFSSSDNAVAGKKLKEATRHRGDQGRVWRGVSRAQQKLSRKVGSSVRSDKSATSLELTLDNEKVKEAVAEYEKKLRSILEGKKNVIGFAFAVNGKVSAADVYASSALFRKLWPKMLKAAAVEAVAEYDKDAKYTSATAEQVRKVMLDAAGGKATEQRPTKHVRMTLQETQSNARATTVDESCGEVIHDSFLNKE